MLYLSYMAIIISTDRLISSSEARKKFGKLLDDIDENEKNYYVILDNGKVKALLVNPHMLIEQGEEEFPDLEKLRRSWDRYSNQVSEALSKLDKMDPKDLPPLLR